MISKKNPRVTSSQKQLLTKICEYFSDQLTSVPWRADYILLRNSQQATNEYTDTIFIPNFNNEDEFQFLCPYKCNAYSSDAAKIITGVYQYRLGKRMGCVYGQQMEPVWFDDIRMTTPQTDMYDLYLKGINLIAHPLHAIIPPINPISESSRGSIMIHSSAHQLMHQNFKNKHVSFKLYVIDINLLL